MGKLEREIENQLVAWAKARGWLGLKFTPMGDRGWPDRIFIKNGTHIWLELKAPGKAPSKLQLHRRAQLMKHGAIIHWTDDLGKAKQLLEQYDKPPIRERLKDGN